MNAGHGFLAIAALAAAGCVTSTPYKPQDGGAYGYDARQIEDDRHVVTFKGDPRTDRDEVTTYVLHRAAALTLNEGGDDFVITDWDVREDQDFRTTYTTVGPHYGVFHGLRPHYFGGIYHGPGFGHGLLTTRTRELPEYAAQMEILLREGPTPDTPSAFDARRVIENLGPRIRRTDDA